MESKKEKISGENWDHGEYGRRLKGSREERKEAEKYVYDNKINKNVIKEISQKMNKYKTLP